MREICARGVVTLVACLLALPAAHAEVLFQNTGNLRTVEQSDRRSGWERVYTQQMGSITVVPSPAFQGGEAVRAFQRYLASGDGRYHSEVVKFDIQQDGQDLYYGHAIYLPANWQFHGDNVTFQQWGLENPGGGAPWILMFVINDQLRVAGVRRAGFGTHTIAPITDLRGTWIRVVTRIRMAAPGNFEVWVNGKKIAEPDAGQPDRRRSATHHPLGGGHLLHGMGEPGAAGDVVAGDPARPLPHRHDLRRGGAGELARRQHAAWAGWWD